MIKGKRLITIFLFEQKLENEGLMEVTATVPSKIVTLSKTYNPAFYKFKKD